MIVSIKQVIPATDNLSRRSILKMRDVLVKQGQIEPLQVQLYCTDDRDVPTYITFYHDVHGNEIMAAAKILGWDTILISPMIKFEE